MPFVFALDFASVRSCRVVVVVVVSSLRRGKLSLWSGRSSSPVEGGDVVTVVRSGRLCVVGLPLTAGGGDGRGVFGHLHHVGAGIDRSGVIKLKKSEPPPRRIDRDCARLFKQIWLVTLVFRGATCSFSGAGALWRTALNRSTTQPKDTKHDQRRRRHWTP